MLEERLRESGVVTTLPSGRYSLGEDFHEPN